MPDAFLPFITRCDGRRGYLDYHLDNTFVTGLPDLVCQLTRPDRTKHLAMMSETDGPKFKKRKAEQGSGRRKRGQSSVCVMYQFKEVKGRGVVYGKWTRSSVEVEGEIRDGRGGWIPNDGDWDGDDDV